MTITSTARSSETAERDAEIHRHYRPGDTPTSLARRIGGVSAETLRHRMIRLNLWQVTPHQRRRRSAPGYKRKTVGREVAAELVLAALHAEEAFDAIVLADAIRRDTDADQRLRAARAQIRHAKAVAQQHGLLADAGGLRE